MKTTTKHPLQAALDAIGMSQAQLARLSGVKQSIICQTINQSGDRMKFSAEAAGKMWPHLKDPETGRPAIDFIALLFPPGGIPKGVAPKPRRR